MGPRLALLLLVFVGALTSQDNAPIERMVQQGLKEPQAMGFLDALVNGIGPRLTSSDGLTQACAWAQERFTRMGYEARLEEWGTFPVGFNRGPWTAAMVAPTQRTLTIVTPAWSAGTRGRQRGKALLAPTTVDAIAASKLSFAGCWVLETPRGRGAGGMATEVRQALDAAYAEHPPLGVVRDSGSYRVWVSGNWRVDPDKLPTLPLIDMIAEDWKAVAAELTAGKAVELEFDIRNHFKRGPIPLYNVIAELRGTEFPDEWVVVGAHIDSWDGATGTTDNGTGVATTMEAARLIAACGERPRRSIRFMLFSGEEQGLLGSEAWVKQHQGELEKISCILVHDGGTNWISGIAGTAAHQADLKRAFAPVLALNAERPFTVREVEGMSGGGSDHSSFLAMNVPGFYWDQKGKVEYVHGWHTQFDTYDIAVPDYQEQSATTVAVGAWGLAQLDHLLSRETLRSARDTIPVARRLGLIFEGESMKVKEATATSVAAVAGIQAGDVLMDLDGVKLADRFALRNALMQGEPKKTMVVERAGARVSLVLQFER